MLWDFYSQTPSMLQKLLTAVTALFTVTTIAQFPKTQDINPSLNLDTLANNSLYLRWRPSYHVLPPGGHMNDPCGPFYDNRTDTYHIFYQSFPQHVQFGNTSWSHATSNDDMVTWKDVSDWRNRSMIAITPDPYFSYDWLGDFSGSTIPVDLNGRSGNNLTMFFTGASRWPDNWQAPYAKHTESQNIATSSDGGVTWQKYPGNPIIDSPPGNWNITAFRDPIVGPDPALDAILGYSEPHYYLLAGSGIRGSLTNPEESPGAGPRIPLYSAPSNDLTNWTFLGAIFEPPQNYSFGGDVTKTGNYGYNFELAGFYSLIEEKANGGDGFTTHWVVNMGAEGYADAGHPTGHYSLYAIGQSYRRPVNQSVEFHIDASGVLDWGNAYAFNSFHDSKGNRRILWGWSDEDMANFGVKAQGFQGALGLPREIFILVTKNVAAPPEGVILGPDIWIATPEPGIFTVKTIGQRPASNVVAGLQAQGSVTRLGTKKVSGIYKLKYCGSDTLHMQTTISDIPPNGSVGVMFRASPKNEEYTTVTYYATNHSIVLDRTHSSLIPNFTKSTYVGHHRPYIFRNGRPQPLTLNLYLDGSLLEIFINDRFAMTGRIYPSRADALGLAVFSEGGTATFKDIRVWDRLLDVWPHRPRNASSPLVFDPYYETHVTFPNPYVEEGLQIYAGYRRRG